MKLSEPLSNKKSKMNTYSGDLAGCSRGLLAGAVDPDRLDPRWKGRIRGQARDASGGAHRRSRWPTAAAPEAVITRYQAHATHEQFHSEIKTDLDLERLPSGKFATNALILHLAQLAYNILRLMGQLGMTGELSPVRHPAKRRRIRTVLQELVHRAALVIHKARQIILDFGQDIGRMTLLKTLRARLRYPRRSPC